MNSASGRLGVLVGSCSEMKDSTGEKRKKFKYSKFRQALIENGDLSMPRQQQLLSDRIREWQGKYEQTDDMVIVGIKI